MRLREVLQFSSKHCFSAPLLAENKNRTLKIAEQLRVKSSVFELAQ